MTHNNNGQEWWLQEVPDDATELTVRNGSYIDFQTQGGMDYISLPDYTWQIHSDSLTITEDEAAELVEGKNVSTGGDDYQDYYRNYEGSQADEDWPWFTGDIIKSFHSLLRSLGLQDKRIIVLKKI